MKTLQTGSCTSCVEVAALDIGVGEHRLDYVEYLLPHARIIIKSIYYLTNRGFKGILVYPFPVWSLIQADTG